MLLDTLGVAGAKRLLAHADNADLQQILDLLRVRIGASGRAGPSATASDEPSLPFPSRPTSS